MHWVNRDDHPISVIYFHLYPNKRAPLPTPPALKPQVSAPPAESPAPTSSAAPVSNNESAAVVPDDEPHLQINEVRGGERKQTLQFALEERETVLRVNLREPVLPDAAAEIEIKFAGSVPEIDAQETNLFAHVLQQVNAVFRSEREARQVRDLNFSSRGVMLLGTAYPVLAVRVGDEWRKKTEATVGDFVFTETADYEVSVETPADLHLFASAEEMRPSIKPQRQANRITHHYAGAHLRDFAIVAGRDLRAEERTIGTLKVRSIYLAGHENMGRRVLVKAAEAVRVFTTHFGTLPFKTINVAEVPLSSRLGSTEFTGLGCIASAFYVDFDAETMRNLPEIVREQRGSLEDSLEFTVARVVAQQWWGIAVGSDPERAPVLDEALANWSALLYYKDLYGEERAALTLDEQVRGVYKIYRTFGGEDMSADHGAREYRNSFQYAAIIASKGALLFVALRRLLGDEKFFSALKSYYHANLLEVAEMDDLRGAFVAEAPLTDRRAVTRTFNRWLSEKRGDEDIAPPDPQLASAIGISPDSVTVAQKSDNGSNGNAFARLGKFFWRQMTRIR